MAWEQGDGQKRLPQTQISEVFPSRDQWVQVKRSPDGYCLYHALLGNGDMEAMQILRTRIASWLEASQNQVFGAMLLRNWILVSTDRADLTRIGNTSEIEAVVHSFSKG